jgi:hypothetical protein
MWISARDLDKTPVITIIADITLRRCIYDKGRDDRKDLQKRQSY